MPWIEDEHYKWLVKNTIIPCVDLFPVVLSRGLPLFLLAKRLQEPAAGIMWSPAGGRMDWDDLPEEGLGSFAPCVERLVARELGEKARVRIIAQLPDIPTCFPTSAFGCPTRTRNTPIVVELLTSLSDLSPENTFGETNLVGIPEILYGEFDDYVKKVVIRAIPHLLA